MAERASVFERIQLGQETVPGTAVPALFAMQMLSMTPSPAGGITMESGDGFKIPTVQSMGNEFTTWAMNAKTPVFDEIGFYFASLLGIPATSTPGGATLAREHLFSMRSSSADNQRTYTIEQGSSLAAIQAAYMIFRALTLNIGTGTVQLSGGAISRRMAYEATLSGNEVQTLTITGDPDGGTFLMTYDSQTTAAIVFNATATQVQTALEALSNIGVGDVLVQGGPLPAAPVTITFQGALAETDVILITVDDALLTGGTTPEATVVETLAGTALTQFDLIPITPQMFKVYVDDEFANLGTSQLLRDFTAVWTMPDRINPVMTINRDQPSMDSHVEIAVQPTLQLGLAADATGRQFVTTKRNGETVFIRLEAIGPEIEAGQSYALIIDVAGKVGAHETLGDNEGIYGITIPFTQVHDADWNKSISVLLRNQVTAY